MDLFSLTDDEVPQPGPGAPSALELCFGIGGLGLGIRRAGFSLTETLNWEIDKIAVQIARDNGHLVVHTDIHGVSWASHAGGVTILAGGVPCQPFSKYGLGLGDMDSRDCFPVVIEAIADTMPEYVLLENVAGLAQQRYLPYVLLIVGLIEALGYRVETRVINCADYGTAQNRKRWILLAAKGDNPLSWAEPMFGKGRPLPHRTVAEALWDPRTGRAGPWGPEDPRRPWFGGLRHLVERATRKPMEAGVKQRWSPIVFPHEPWMWERPATTIAGRPLLTAPGTNANAVNGALKSMNDGVRLTIPQMARIQGLPVDYRFDDVSMTEAAKRIGNVFPPQPAEALARTLTAPLLGHDHLPTRVPALI
jgi:DNA (cytosine-5)-methyltransferase 1